MPYALALCLLAWIFASIDLGAFVDALRAVNVVGYVTVGVVVTFLILVADAYATSRVFRATVAPVTTLDAFIMRGASYLPAMINYHVGMAWMAWFMAKLSDANIQRVTGATIVIYATTFGALYCLALIGAILIGDRVWGLLPVVLGIGGLGIGYLLVLLVQPAFLQGVRIVAPLLETGAKGQLVLLIQRIPHVAALFIGTWVPFEFFGVQIPFASALALIPVMMFVLTLPLTPLGFGTRDGVALLLLTPFYEGAPDEARAAIVASTVSWGALLSLINFLVSLGLMRVAQRRIRARNQGH
jgi:hypothetical protein